MRPGKNPTPSRELDLTKLWRTLKEEPPGPIHMLNGRSVARVAKSRSATKDHPSR
jgi:hypothetical protein